jgi:hypothetical protein
MVFRSQFQEGHCNWESPGLGPHQMLEPKDPVCFGSKLEVEGIKGN